MPPNRFESEVESFLEGSHGDRTHIKRAGHHTVTPLCGTLLHAIELHAELGEGALVGCGGVPVRDFLLPARLVGGGSGIKLSLRAESGPQSAFWGVLGEFCTGWARRGYVLGEFCPGSGSACGTKFSLRGLFAARA